MRNPWQGKLWRSYHIACAHCNFEDEIEGWNGAPTRQEAEHRWRREGWVQRHGLWYCRNCKAAADG